MVSILLFYLLLQQSLSVNTAPPPIRVARIEITGNKYTSDAVIRSRLLIHEGDIFRIRSMKQSMRRIYQLGNFRKLDFRISPTSNPELADLLIVVEEKKPNQIDAGGGFSQSEGLLGSLDFESRNALDAGNHVSVRLERGKRFSDYQIIFVRPQLLLPAVSAGASLSLSRSNYFASSVEQQVVGASAWLGIPWSYEWTGVFGYAFQTKEGTETSEETRFPLIDAEEHQIIANIRRTAFAEEDWAMQQVNQIDFTFKFSGGILGGDSDYWKITSGFARFLSGFSKSQKMAFHVEAGYTKPFSNKELPFDQRFFAGGSDSIRGYSTFGVGPVLKNSKSGVYEVVGGNKLFTASMEYQIPVWRPFLFDIFVDYGNTFQQGENIDLRKMHGSAGIELRFQPEFLGSIPLRLIYAVNFKRGRLLLLPGSDQPGVTSIQFAAGASF